MKKLKKLLVIVLSIIMVTDTFSFFPQSEKKVYAAETRTYGAFTVSADSQEVLGAVSYSASVLTFGAGAAGNSYTIKQDNVDTATGDRIVVNGGTNENPVTITLDGVNINISDISDIAMQIQGSSVVNLVLGDGSNNKLQSSNMYFAGLNVSSGASITISGSGELTATGGTYGAGIGEGYYGSGGNITISGGTVTAIGGSFGAGIGGGFNGSGGNITISGGTVTATGGIGAAGIGGGQAGAGGTINISGGTVTATGGSSGAGIGGGSAGAGGTINISGGKVTAEGGSYGAGIGGGSTGYGADVDGSGGNITIRGGTVTATGGSNGAGIGGGSNGTGGMLKINQDATVIAASDGNKNALDVNTTVSATEEGTVANIIQANFESPLENETTVEVRDGHCQSLSDSLKYKTPNTSIKSIAFTSPKVKENSSYTLFESKVDGTGKYLQNENESVKFATADMGGVKSYDGVKCTDDWPVIVGTDIFKYAQGDEVTLTAVDIEGKVFKEWSVVSGGITLTNSDNKEITFIMPANVVELSQEYAVSNVTANPAAGTYTTNQNITLSTVTEGADIYYTTDGSDPSSTNGTKYTGAISVTGIECSEVTTTIKAIAVKSGIADSKITSFEYIIAVPDITAPTAKIIVGTNYWNSFFNMLTFEHFFKDTKQVTIIGEDAQTSVAKIEYYLSDSELTKEQAETLEDSMWTTYTKTFSINKNSKKIIYAKVTDAAGNFTIINSEGVVVYEDSIQDTTGITYIKGVDKDQTAKVTLNGNTVKDIRHGSNTLISGTDYIVTTDGTITFKESYLESLAVSETAYMMTISYNPMGESYVLDMDGEVDNNQAPATTNIDITVRKPKLISITEPAAITGITNGTDKTASALGLPGTVTISTEDNTVTTANVSWDLTNLAKGSYDKTVLTEQTFTVNGTVTLPDTIDTDGKDLTTKVQVTVNAAPFVGNVIANPVAGTYTTNQRVTLSTETDGATIYYTTDGTTPTIDSSVYSEAISVTGIEGKSVATTIQVIAVKEGMQTSGVASMTYVIELPAPLPVSSTYVVTVNNGTGDGRYKEGATVNITAEEAPSGKEFDKWVLVKGDVSIKIATNEHTSFTMPSEDVEVTAIYKDKETEPIPTVSIYKIIEGASGIHELSTDAVLTFTCNGELNKLTGIYVDDELVDKSNYTLKSGSTILTLKAEYLNTLSVGTHKLRFQYDNGSAETTFVIKEASKEAETTEAGTKEAETTEVGTKEVETKETETIEVKTNKDETIQNATIQSNEDRNLQTGDTTPIVWLFILAVISGAGVLGLISKKKQ